MGTVERAGDDHTSEVESGEEEEIVGGGELAQHLMKRSVKTCILRLVLHSASLLVIVSHMC